MIHGNKEENRVPYKEIEPEKRYDYCRRCNKETLIKIIRPNKEMISDISDQALNVRGTCSGRFSVLSFPKIMILGNVISFSTSPSPVDRFINSPVNSNKVAVFVLICLWIHDV